MKIKSSLLLFFLVCSALALRAQDDTLTGFDFSDTTLIGFTANYGIPGNLGFAIRAEDSLGTARLLSYSNGATNFAATATGWDNGIDNKFWSVKFKADGYSSIKVSAKLSSGGNKPGPKFWKVQAMKSGGAWVDLPGGNITVANNWTTGVITDLVLPFQFDNPGTTSLYIRWIMTSNESTGGVDVLPDGICKIDDILVTGTNSVGLVTLLYELPANIYPNPTADYLNVVAPFEPESVIMTDSRGIKAAFGEINGNAATFNLQHLPSGLYLLIIRGEKKEQMIVRKVVVE